MNKPQRRYCVISDYNGYLERVGWSVWDTELCVNVVSTEQLDKRYSVLVVADLLNSGVLVHHVEA